MSTPPSVLRVALQHRKPVPEQLRVLSKLPTPFCVCKRCYAHCEDIPQHILVCPPLPKQSFIAERVIGLLQFVRAQKYLISEFNLASPTSAKKAIIYSVAYIELIHEMFQQLLLMNMPLLATDPSQTNANLGKMTRRRRYETIEESIAEVTEHWQRKLHAEMAEQEKRHGTD